MNCVLYIFPLKKRYIFQQWISENIHGHLPEWNHGQARASKRARRLQTSTSSIPREISSDFFRVQMKTLVFFQKIHVISNGFISFHILSYRFMWHLIACHIFSYHIISYHVMSYHIMSCHIISYHIMSDHIVSYRFISLRFISCHIISYHFISFHIISYHFISLHLFHLFHMISSQSLIRDTSLFSVLSSIFLSGFIFPSAIFTGDTVMLTLAKVPYHTCFQFWQKRASFCKAIHLLFQKSNILNEKTLRWLTFWFSISCFAKRKEL